MGFHVTERALEAVGYVAAFSADQVIRNLGSEYDPVVISETPSEASAHLYHHSEEVYRVTITVEKVED